MTAYKRKKYLQLGVTGRPLASSAQIIKTNPDLIIDCIYYCFRYTDSKQFSGYVLLSNWHPFQSPNSMEFASLNAVVVLQSSRYAKSISSNPTAAKCLFSILRVFRLYATGNVSSSAVDQRNLFIG
jgi:hypothetical protein